MKKINEIYDNRIRKYYNTIFIKRFFDIVLSLLAIVAVFIPCLIIAIIIFAQDKKMSFMQDRVGRNGEIFKIIKFRTMYVGSDKLEPGIIKNSKNGFVQIVNDPRVTKFGKILRKTSLDELPQFLNVLKGDMSLIGPRPFIKLESDQLSEIESYRQKVYPGLTGLAQLKGRSKLSIHEVAKLDLEYIEKYTLGRDIEIFISTIFVVLEGV